ncbi:ABC-2 type transport system permease protein [Lentzea atacamensis]|uniref:ABC-2 type transport system permease protein n=1 Tax=Lentzea atacamensis TaxID=531938 RepID=A0ABX9E4Z7_9PSEU|nr:ABC transporter permease [Lentzea atacamensis]RAS64102.1 ABC-2 type transport system permease protein [Lentzea atacamensis]
MTSARAVSLVARREFVTKVRTRSFLIGTAVIIAVLAGYVVLQSVLFDDQQRSVVGLSGQATQLADPLREKAKSFGIEVETRDVTTVDSAERQVRDGSLDALVTGAPPALKMIVKGSGDEVLTTVLNDVLRQQVLVAQLAEAGITPQQVAQNLANVNVDVTALEPVDPQRGQRLAIGLIVAALLYYSLLVYGTMVAQGVVEEKSSRVVEILLATVRPWQLLLGKVIGLGAVGLLQLLVISMVGLGLSSAFDVIDVGALGATALLTGVLWYLLGFFLYATVFAAAASLVSRQEELQSVLTPISMTIIVAFVAGINLMIGSPSGTTVTVLSLLPPFAPILMPGRMAMGVATTWQVLLAIALALAAIAAITWLGGKVYANAVLRTGARVKLREALKV